MAALAETISMSSTEREDFFSAYLSYTSDTEVPTNFHRWSIISTIGAMLGRQFWLQHGAFNIYPTMYTMLIGSPGTRKSTAIKLAKQLILQTNYSTIAASKTSKEKFLMDLAGDLGLDTPAINSSSKVDNFLEQNLWGDDHSSKPNAEMFIMADEFNTFMGHGNLEFVSMLGDLWDYEGLYEYRIKTGKSLYINNPTISILGGNTPTGFSMAFPADIIGQGFFSRLLLIYGEPNGKRITFPRVPDPESTRAIVGYLQLIKSKILGAATLSKASYRLFDQIYQSNPYVDDIRFESYSNRRFTHLIKLTLICAAARLSTEIDERDVTYANTILKHAEHNMPRALGEYGKSKNADVTHKIIQYIYSQIGIVTYKDLWKQVSADLPSISDLAVILENLSAAEKIQRAPEGKGFLPMRKVFNYENDQTLDFSMLTPEERQMVNL